MVIVHGELLNSQMVTSEIWRGCKSLEKKQVLLVDHQTGFALQMVLLYVLQLILLNFGGYQQLVTKHDGFGVMYGSV